ncbi:hypothetical protein [Litchfieldella xinjiangensis]|uniref:hypothetical protein n=1 Tax=Litchfieldella xinjiangensis TaxID=1166948 RepID=UPI0005BB78EA|nr:hypothetical protein [Halomonas xinjiangensis]
MTTEPQRLQYLEAMGLTAWTGRYRLPNARPTPECEWVLPEEPPAKSPNERLHHLLEAIPESPAAAPSTPSAPPSRPHGRARALLGDSPTEVPKQPDTPERHVASEPTSEAAAAEGTTPQQPLRFTLQIAALDRRWLVWTPEEAPPSGMSRQLLSNILAAAGIEPAHAIEFQTFRWPMMEGLPVESPLDEAREGLRAFLAGREGWHPERLLLFGEDETLADVLAIEDEYATLLGLPVWRGPSFDALASRAEAKRAILPLLKSWQTSWRQGRTSHD